MKPKHASVMLCLGCAVQIVRSASPLDNWTVESPLPMGGGTSGGINMRSGITYGGGQFVVVGYGGKIFTSPDGAAWTQRNSGTTNFLHGVAYGNGLFVAVGQNGTVSTSPDGLTWASQPFGSPAELFAISWGSGEFVAVGRGTIATSSDGVAWAVLQPGSVWTSQNGGGWNLQQGQDMFVDVAYGDGRFIAVGTESLGFLSFTPVIVTSTDGFTWLQLLNYQAGIPFMSLAFGNGEFVGQGGWVSRLTPPSALISGDGLSWTAHVTGGYATNLFGMAFGAGNFVAVGWPGTIYTSTDGIGWTPRTSGTRDVLYGVAYGNGRFVVTGMNGTILESGEIIGLGPISLLPHGLVQGTVMGADGQNYRVEVSTDLANWLAVTNVTTTNGTAQFFDAGASNLTGRFYRAVAP